MKYAYPAVFTPDPEGGFEVDVPDITERTSYGCFTFGSTMTDAPANAEDALNLVLCVMEDDGVTIPAPTPIKEIEVPDGGSVRMVQADTCQYRKQNPVKENKEIDWGEPVGKEIW